MGVGVGRVDFKSRQKKRITYARTVHNSKVTLMYKPNVKPKVDLISLIIVSAADIDTI